ncbi:hypothetical protein PTW37_00375 [Arthrobacter agilis]|uniref:hypothetical protein n=1 Tax=Arthrobacter agilis TaxID=37921 RepID=UPI002365841A|nr:hypothetical protein [Arthrobacter agilis]WDF33434.1 hypothetical protein PTW37_00375 [Arthrobacter agilis]
MAGADRGTTAMVLESITRRADRHRPLHPAVLGLLIGVGAALVGLAPWLVSGARLPLQNLWATPTAPDDMPRALLPIGQYHLLTIVGLLVTGGAAAGTVLRVWIPDRRRTVTGSAVAGLLAVHVAAAAQSLTVAGSGLSAGPTARIYLVGILAGVVVTLAAAVVALLLLSAASRTAATLGVGLVAVPTALWAGEWALAFAEPFEVPAWVHLAIRWLPAVLVGCALAWCGLASMRRRAIWLVDLALLWLVPPVFDTVRTVFGTRVYLGDPGAMLTLARDALSSSLGPGGGSAATVATAVVIALAGLLVRAALRRRRSST